MTTFTLKCRDEQSARVLARAAAKLGFVFASCEGEIFSVRWGGSFERLCEIGDFARECDLAGDFEVSELYMQYARIQ